MKQPCGRDSADKGRPKLLDLSLRPFRGPELSIIISARSRFQSNDSCAPSRAAKSSSVQPRANARRQPHPPAATRQKRFSRMTIIPTHLEQQSGIQDGDLVPAAARASACRREKAGDFRMSNCSRYFRSCSASGPGGKNDAGQLRPVDSSVRPQKPHLPIVAAPPPQREATSTPHVPLDQRRARRRPTAQTVRATVLFPLATPPSDTDDSHSVVGQRSVV